MCVTQQPWGQQQPQQSWPPPSWPTQQTQQSRPATSWPTQQTGQWVQQPGQYSGGQYPGGQYPGGQYPGGFQPRPRRSNPLRTIFLAIMLIIGIGFLLVSLSSFLSGGDESEKVLPDSTVTTAPEEPGTGTGAGTGTAVDVPTEPDFNPPDLPMPTTYRQATQWVRTNAVYDQSVTVPTNCGLTQIDPTTASAGALEKHLNQMVTCLLAVWLPPMEAAGFEVPRPPVTVYTQPITTGCGQQDDLYNASYCAGDQRIYYGKQLYRIFPRDVATPPFMIDMVMGHEFGHLLQARTGILVSATALGQQNDDSDEQESYDRRLEQQADCWAGTFLTAVGEASQISESQQRGLQQVAYNLGDDVLSGKSGYVGGHGSGKARQRWFTTGQATDQAGTCNTFTVPESQVR